MKIRIKGNSIRYRLTKTDVNTLSETGYIEEHTDFGAQTLVYALQSKKSGGMAAMLENQEITLYISDEMVTELTTTDRVGFDYHDGPLYLLVEKDFTCLDNVAEDQSDNYPNPLATAV
ncbi:hypothetical protein KXQ82_09615 [Mucilaginibacter sp. HMF5004]|uniref:DUF7009 family protein n=1 Tax=Mucilaginibacter rivuli TaxID=2857527 RepID=UPI001C5E9B26|nr:hypothetical protein [Mucilaginibacter rivuli]MBW4889974.1 hypothetical protein [Mucilaginibacter rivuli]